MVTAEVVMGVTKIKVAKSTSPSTTRAVPNIFHLSPIREDSYPCCNGQSRNQHRQQNLEGCRHNASLVFGQSGIVS